VGVLTIVIGQYRSGRGFVSDRDNTREVRHIAGAGAGEQRK
jgi:hypothetical protein